MELESDHKFELSQQEDEGDHPNIPLLPLKSPNDEEADDEITPVVHERREEHQFHSGTQKKPKFPLVMMLLSLVFAILGIVAFTRAAYLEKKAATASSSKVPDYFQTTPQIYAGKTLVSKNAVTLRH